MIIGVDLDSTVYPFMKNYLAFIISEGRYDIPTGYQPTTWEFYKDLGMTTEEFVDSLERGAKQGKIFKGDGFGDMPFAGFTNTARQWRSELGHSVHLITHRNVTGAVQTTMEWLDSYGISFDIHFDAIHFVHDKTLVDTDILFDDSPANREAHVRAGKRCVLYTQPWNAHVDGHRVDSWYEADKLIRSDWRSQ